MNKRHDRYVSYLFTYLLSPVKRNLLWVTTVEEISWTIYLGEPRVDILLSLEKGDSMVVVEITLLCESAFETSILGWILALELAWGVGGAWALRILSKMLAWESIFMGEFTAEDEDGGSDEALIPRDRLINGFMSFSSSEMSSTWINGIWTGLSVSSSLSLLIGMVSMDGCFGELSFCRFRLGDDIRLNDRYHLFFDTSNWYKHHF